LDSRGYACEDTDSLDSISQHLKRLIGLHFNMMYR
jgi:hypothetical protein